MIISIDILSNSWLSLKKVLILSCRSCLAGNSGSDLVISQGICFLNLILIISKELTLSQKAEWEEYFTTEHKKANEIKSKIEQTDKEIDQMVYELYGLTEEEIEIVERNTK